MLPVIDGKKNVDKPTHFQWFAGFRFLLACESLGFVIQRNFRPKSDDTICMLSLLPAELRRKSYMVLNNRNTA